MEPTTLLAAVHELAHEFITPATLGIVVVPTMILAFVIAVMMKRI